MKITEQNTGKMKHQDNVFPPKIINFILMTPDWNDLDKIPDTEFKTMFMDMVKQLKDLNVFQKNTNSYMK